MTVHPAFGSPSFGLVVKGLLELHRLIGEGKDDSAEAQAARDALDMSWKALSRIDKERAQWLSEDLYSISEPSTPVSRKAMNSQARQQFKEAIESHQSRQWDRALALLRQAREFLPPAVLSFNRGSLWFDAGYPDIAATFYGHAAKCEPQNPHYQTLYTTTLEVARLVAESSAERN